MTRSAGWGSCFSATQPSWRTGSSACWRRVGGETPVPALRPVVSSPPPSEPDLRLPPHPALHEHIERLPARAASVVSEVPAPVSGNGAPVFTGDLLPSSVLRAHWTPSPCGRLSRPPWWHVTATTTTGPPPRPGGNSGRCACPDPTNSGSAGAAGTLPTFTHRPVGRVGAQLYPGGIAARYRNTARGLVRPISNRTNETVPHDNRDRAPQQPIAASFGAAVLYRGLKHWFVSYAFLPCYRTRPAGGGPLLDRQGLLPPSASPQASGCPSASPDRYGGRGRGLSPRPVISRLVAQY
jgi:hypothetical protein